MNDFIIKKLGKQELAYKGGKPGNRAGQYFLISKNHISFFPPLKKEISQDIQILNLVSHNQEYPSQAKYIYSNDKYHGSSAENPRDDERIYLNLRINPNYDTYLKDDIIIIKKEIFKNEDEVDELAYIITRYRESLNPKDYKNLLNLIDKNKIDARSNNYSYASLNDLSIIKDYKNRLYGKVMSDEIIIPKTDDTLLKSKTPNDGSIVKKEEIELKIFENQIKRIIFDKFQYKCLVTGIGYKWQEPGGSKHTWKGITGAHIKPRAHFGEYSSANIIPLLEPIHQLFDRGIFTINDDSTLKIHPKALVDSLLSNFHPYHNMKLVLPKGITLSLKYIKHHQKEVFGNFTTGKQIRSLKK